MRSRFLLGLKFVLGAAVGWVALVALSGAVETSRVPVTLPSKLVTIDESYVVATGTWVAEGTKQAFPLQTTELQCEKPQMQCIAATASVGFGGTLYPELNFYKVVDWSASQLVFVDNAPTCVSYVYTIDLLTQSASGIRRKRSSEAGLPDLCKGVEDELRLSLQDGFTVSKALRKEAEPWFGTLAFLPLKIFE